MEFVSGGGGWRVAGDCADACIETATSISARTLDVASHRELVRFKAIREQARGYTGDVNCPTSKRISDDYAGALLLARRVRALPLLRAPGSARGSSGRTYAGR